MAQYIDKDAVVAEIKRRISLFQKEKEKQKKWSIEASQVNVISLGARIAMLEEILSFLNTLEVKEVDLESNSFDATICRIGSTYLKEMDRDAIAKALEPYKNGDKVKVIIKAQKGE